MAGTITSGVFPVNVTSIKVNTAAAGAETPTWSDIAELEEATLEIENTTQEWISFASGGWGSALVTAKKAKLTLKGKRSIGDAGNDLIASKLLGIGQDSYIGVQITHPNGDTLVWDKMACAVSNNGASGKADDVGALEAECIGHGKPTFTEAT